MKRKRWIEVAIWLLLAAAVFALAVWLRPSGLDRWLQDVRNPVAVSGNVLAVVAATIMFISTARDYRKRVRAAEEDPSKRLRRRITRVNDAFTEAAQLMDELRRDLEAQQSAREALLAEAERQQQLLAVNKEEAEKIRQILTNETKDTIRAGRRRDWMFFALGVAVSIPVGILVNHIS